MLSSTNSPPASPLTHHKLYSITNITPCSSPDHTFTNPRTLTRSTSCGSVFVKGNTEGDGEVFKGNSTTNISPQHRGEKREDSGNYSLSGSEDPCAQSTSTEELNRAANIDDQDSRHSSREGSSAWDHMGLPYPCEEDTTNKILNLLEEIRRENQELHHDLSNPLFRSQPTTSNDAAFSQRLYNLEHKVDSSSNKIITCFAVFAIFLIPLMVTAHIFAMYYKSKAIARGPKLDTGIAIELVVLALSLLILCCTFSYGVFSYYNQSSENEMITTCNALMYNASQIVELYRNCSLDSSNKDTKGTSSETSLTEVSSLSSLGDLRVVNP